jgi:group I intron endonuclease
MLIYEAYNTKNGKVYIGLTTTTLEVRKASHLRSAKSGSNAYFHKAIRKYGEGAFEWSVIGTTTTLEKLYELEKLVIGMYEFEQTYNISLGGEHSAYGMRHSEETKQLCGQYAKQRWDGKRASDIYPEEAFLCDTYKEAKKKYGIPKTTWYRRKKLDLT